MVSLPLLLAALPLDVREQYEAIAKELKMDPTDLVIVKLRQCVKDIRRDGST
jgi:hypothetical protein